MGKPTYTRSYCKKRRGQSTVLWPLFIDLSNTKTFVPLCPLAKSKYPHQLTYRKTTNVYGHTVVFNFRYFLDDLKTILVRINR